MFANDPMLAQQFLKHTNSHNLINDTANIQIERL